MNSAGDLFLVDSHRVRKLTPDGIITTVVGGDSSGCPQTGSSTFSGAVDFDGVAVDSAGSLIFASCNRVWKFVPGGTVTLLGGNGTHGHSGDGGPAVSAQFSNPRGFAVDGAGDVFVADGFGNPFSSQGGAIRRMHPTNQTVLIGAVLDAGSESRLAVSPGKIVVIYGAGLGPSQLVANQPANGIFGTELAGTTVTMNGLSAPVIYTSATQVGAIAPYEISGSTSAQVIVTSTSGISPAFAIPVSASAPSFFSQNGTGAGQAAVVNLDGSLNDAAHPVKIGGYVTLYATGEGQTSPAGVDGRIAATAPYPQPLLPVIVTVGGVPAPYAYAGAAPMLVAGLMQINVRIPDGVQPGGYVPVVLTVGNASTIGGAAWIAVSGN